MINRVPSAPFATNADDSPHASRGLHGGSIHARLAAVKAAGNPLLEAAQPLLRALADMPDQLPGGEVEILHSLLEREVSAFQALCTEARIRTEHALAASYSLCTALDEAAGSTEWGGGRGGETGIWSLHQLAAQFHGDAKGGDKVFLLIGHLAAAPAEHADLLDVLLQILGLGFQGRFGSVTQGRAQLDSIRDRLLVVLLKAREEIAIELSPHWRGAAGGKLAIVRGVPIWASGAVLALASVGLFSWYRLQLDARLALVRTQVAAIDLAPVSNASAPAAAPLRLRQLLAGEIARGTVRVVEDDDHSAVSFRGDAMFEAGRASVGDRSLATLEKVGREISRVPGQVQVAGHSDNQPIRTREFSSNQVLSERRAQAVARLLRDQGVAAERLEVEGRGDTEPLADNATTEGRARNRRVDVVVTVPSGGVATRSANAAPGS